MGCNLTKSIVVGGARSIDNISKHSDIKQKTDGADTIKPEEKAIKVLVNNEAAEDNFDSKNSNKQNVGNIETNIIGFLGYDGSDIIADERIDCEDCYCHLEWNTVC